MIEDNPFAESTGEDILDAAERCIYFRTDSAKYLKENIKELRKVLRKDKLYKLPHILNSTKSWKHFIEEVLPYYYAEEQMRDLC